MSETDALVFGMTVEAAEAGVMGTDVVGFRSGRGSVPVIVGASGAEAVSGPGATPDAGAAS
jgi:hypothetical protein